MTFCACLLLFAWEPSMADLDGFPTRADTRPLVYQQCKYVEHLREVYAVHPRPVRIKRMIEDMEQRLEAWSTLDLAWTGHMHGDVRKLRRLIGDEAFWTKRMPEPFPSR